LTGNRVSRKIDDYQQVIACCHRSVKGIEPPNKAIAADDASLIRPTKIDFYHQLIAICHNLAKGIKAPNQAIAADDALLIRPTETVFF
jgi:hypothetical protein